MYYNELRYNMPREQQSTCHTDNCDGLQLIADYNYRGTGKPQYRKWCVTCYQEKRAVNAGFKTNMEYIHDLHPYLKFRKDYCENIDSRLGFVCPTPKELYLAVSAILQVDHIDGNPHNNDEKNCQTFCVLCHTYKSWTSGDMVSPGRKSLEQIS